MSAAKTPKEYTASAEPQSLPEIAPFVSAAAAESATESLRRALQAKVDGDLEVLLRTREVYLGQAWRPLMYESFAAYCAAEFATFQKAQTKDQREALFRSLALATNEVSGNLPPQVWAELLGISDQTVRRAFRAVKDEMAVHRDASQIAEKRERGFGFEERRKFEGLVRADHAAKVKGEPLTQVDAAFRLGVGQATVSYYRKYAAHNPDQVAEVLAKEPADRHALLMQQFGTTTVSTEPASDIATTRLAEADRDAHALREVVDRLTAHLDDPVWERDAFYWPDLAALYAKAGVADVVQVLLRDLAKLGLDVEATVATGVETWRHDPRPAAIRRRTWWAWVRKGKRSVAELAAEASTKPETVAGAVRAVDALPAERRLPALGARPADADLPEVLTWP